MNLEARMARRHFSDVLKFCLQHQDDRIRVWRPCGERTLAACIRLRHTEQSPSVMAFGCTFRSPLVRIDGTLNSERYISGVLRPLALYFIQALRNHTFQKDNARPHVTCILRTFFDMEYVRRFFLCLHVHQNSHQ
ncbi:uncharacterized protein TNCV_3372261 [Trichonephila clavipes]|nr:uncharacterized protein TNCV_3372261 [Trichonephila clavipes]